MKKFISGACLLMIAMRNCNNVLKKSFQSIQRLFYTVDHELLRLDNKFPVFYSLSESVLGALQVDFRTSSTWN
ncbi:unnamed protein product [Rhizophagus irregularis]|nr:unnamed protein product [Rhizophagus irregularis]CAB4432608.1 unnamed protein product [Rhizophagus irregularis]